MQENMNYDIAVISYPLMDPRKNTEDFSHYMQLNYTSIDPWDATVYIHIPFCSRICRFCVYSRETPDNDGVIIKNYLDALIDEIRMYGETAYVQSLKIGAIFIGGGTPTCLSSNQIMALLCACKKYLPITNSTEISMESNIMTTNEEKIACMVENGVHRISTGLQTFNTKYRDIMGLKISIDDIDRWVVMNEKYHSTDLSFDLLYGLPGQTVKEWLEDIHLGLSYPVKHFSIYKLIVLANSKLYYDLRSGNVPEIPGREAVFEMYVEADKMLKQHGFNMQTVQEYNICGQSSKYWDLVYDGYGDNIAFGASSYGFLNGITFQNISDVHKYIDCIKEKRLPIKMVSDKINYEQMMERTIILQFRRSYVENNIFYDQYGKKVEEIFEPIIVKLMEEKMIVKEDNKYRLTSMGEFNQGNISVSFMESTFKKISLLKKKMAIGNHVVPDAVTKFI